MNGPTERDLLDSVFARLGPLLPPGQCFAIGSMYQKRLVSAPSVPGEEHSGGERGQTGARRAATAGAIEASSLVLQQGEAVTITTRHAQLEVREAGIA